MDSWMVKCGAIDFLLKRILLQMFRQKKTHTTKSKEMFERLENEHNWDLFPLPQLSNADLEMLYTSMEKTAISISGGEEEYNQNDRLPIPYLCSSKMEILSNIIGEYLGFGFEDGVNMTIHLKKGEWNKDSKNYKFIAFDERNDPILNIQTSVISTHNPFGVSFKKKIRYDDNIDNLYRILIKNETIYGINEDKTWANDFKNFFESEIPGSWENSVIPVMIEKLVNLHTMPELINNILRQSKLKGGKKSKKKKRKKTKKNQKKLKNKTRKNN